MQKLGRALLTRNHRGDTIVEVIIVTAILALVLAGSYSLSSHALQNGLDSNKRTEATAIAQRQTEYIKDAYLHDSAQLDKYDPTKDNPYDNFCIIDPNAVQPTADAASATCLNYQNKGLSVTISYTGDDPAPPTPKRVFAVKATWVKTTVNNPDIVNLYYQTP